MSWSSGALASPAQVVKSVPADNTVNTAAMGPRATNVQHGTAAAEKVAAIAAPLAVGTSRAEPDDEDDPDLKAALALSLTLNGSASTGDRQPPSALLPSRQASWSSLGQVAANNVIDLDD